MMLTMLIILYYTAIRYKLQKDHMKKAGVGPTSQISAAIHCKI